MQFVGEVHDVEIVLHRLAVGREHLPDVFHRSGVVVREDIGADALFAQGVDLAELLHRNLREECAVGPCDVVVGDLRSAGEAAHFVAGFVERDVAVFEASDHLGRVAGVDELRHGVHAETAECRRAAVEIQTYEDPSEVENYIFDLFHIRIF